MEFSPNRLTPFQREVLRAFFEREAGFFLTGGAALAGFHLGHRQTDDLDLFTLDDDAFERGPFVVEDAARALHAATTTRQQAPGFRRLVLTRDQHAVVVDLVRERVHQVAPEKLEIDGIRVDPPVEILANKLAAVAGRAEIRDVVDLMCLERTGLPLGPALVAAAEKDGGATPATLAWVLSQLQIGDGASLPGELAPVELRAYVADLIRRLRLAAAPG